jgi:hypothetical protein
MPQLYLVGLGVDGRLHLTAEAVQTLDAVDIIFALVDDLGLLDDWVERVPIQDLAALYPEAGLRADVYAAISEHICAEAAVSSFDTVMADLGEDLGYAVQLFDATTLLQGDYALNPKVPALIFQIANTLSPQVQRGDPPPALLRPLRDHLRRFYPAASTCKIVQSSSVPWEASEVRTLALDALGEEPLDLWRRPTLYLPA